MDSQRMDKAIRLFVFYSLLVLCFAEEQKNNINKTRLSDDSDGAKDSTVLELNDTVLNSITSSKDTSDEFLEKQVRTSESSNFNRSDGVKLRKNSSNSIQFSKINLTESDNSTRENTSDDSLVVPIGSSHSNFAEAFEIFTQCPENCVCEPKLSSVSCQSEFSERLLSSYSYHDNENNTELLFKGDNNSFIPFIMKKLCLNDIDLPNLNISSISKTIEDSSTVDKCNYHQNDNCTEEADDEFIKAIHKFYHNSRNNLENKTLVSLLSNEKKMALYTVKDTLKYQRLISLNELLIRNCNVSKIPKGALKLLPYLAKLDLSNNALSKLRSHSFAGLCRLLHLDISNNQLKDINRTFVHLRSLESLKLNSNQLSKLSPTTFIGLNKVTYLNLGDNSISNVDIAAFQPLSSLSTLILNNNPLLTLVRLNFFGSRLQYIDVSNIKIDKIPQVITQSIRSLRLAGNSLIAIQRGDLESYPYLGELNLEQNRLEVLEEDALGRHEYLQRLFMGDNNLKEVPQSLPISLIELFLQMNQISTLNDGDFEGLASLEQLFLLGNNISSISINAFGDLINLKTLNLRANQITTLRVPIFAKLSKLSTLDLSENPLLTIQFEPFLGLEQLQVLHLSNIEEETAIAEDSFTPFMSLEVLDLEESPGLCQNILNSVTIVSSLKSLREMYLTQCDVASLRRDIRTALPNLEHWWVSSETDGGYSVIDVNTDRNETFELLGKYEEPSDFNVTNNESQILIDVMSNNIQNESDVQENRISNGVGLTAKETQNNNEIPTFGNQTMDRPTRVTSTSSDSSSYDLSSRYTTEKMKEERNSGYEEVPTNLTRKSLVNITKGFESTESQVNGTLLQDSLNYESNNSLSDKPSNSREKLKNIETIDLSSELQAIPLRRSPRTVEDVKELSSRSVGESRYLGQEDSSEINDSDQAIRTAFEESDYTINAIDMDRILPADLVTEVSSLSNGGDSTNSIGLKSSQELVYNMSREIKLTTTPFKNISKFEEDKEASNIQTSKFHKTTSVIDIGNSSKEYHSHNNQTLHRNAKNHFILSNSSQKYRKELPKQQQQNTSIPSRISPNPPSEQQPETGVASGSHGGIDKLSVLVGGRQNIPNPITNGGGYINIQKDVENRSSTVHINKDIYLFRGDSRHEIHNILKHSNISVTANGSTDAVNDDGMPLNKMFDIFDHRKALSLVVTFIAAVMVFITFGAMLMFAIIRIKFGMNRIFSNRFYGGTSTVGERLSRSNSINCESPYRETLQARVGNRLTVSSKACKSEQNAYKPTHKSFISASTKYFSRSFLSSKVSRIKKSEEIRAALLENVSLGDYEGEFQSRKSSPIVIKNNSSGFDDIALTCDGNCQMNDLTSYDDECRECRTCFSESYEDSKYNQLLQQQYGNYEHVDHLFGENFNNLDSPENCCKISNSTPTIADYSFSNFPPNSSECSFDNNFPLDEQDEYYDNVPEAQALEQHFHNIHSKYSHKYA